MGKDDLGRIAAEPAQRDVGLHHGYEAVVGSGLDVDGTSLRGQGVHGGLDGGVIAGSIRRDEHVGCSHGGYRAGFCDGVTGHGGGGTAIVDSVRRVKRCGQLVGADGQEACGVNLCGSSAGGRCGVDAVALSTAAPIAALYCCVVAAGIQETEVPAGAMVKPTVGDVDPAMPADP